MLLVKLQVKANFLELFKMYGRHSIKIFELLPEGSERAPGYKY